jgi:DNA-binding NarL/FixJ family response regulator
MPADPLRVVLADDEPLVRSGLALVLSGAGIRVVGEAGDGAEAVRLSGVLHPDVVVLDVRMPGTDGVEATRQLRVGGAVGPAVLILTTFHEDAAVRAALAAGAAGFLLKSAAPCDLELAVRAVARGDAWLDPPVARTVLRHLADQPSGGRSDPPELSRLTPREREILAFAAHGFSNREIADRLVLSEATIKTHISRVLTKLDVHDRAQAVVVAYRAGLVRPP